MIMARSVKLIIIMLINSNDANDIIIKDDESNNKDEGKKVGKINKINIEAN